jgi:hypothetical protein
MKRSVDDLTDEELLVVHNGKPIYRMNKNLLARQNCVDNLPAIIEQHKIKLQIYEWIKEEDDNEILMEYASWVRDVEFTLQELWNFEKNVNFHRFWDTPNCRCPKMDNNDHYPHGHYYISGDCALHWGKRD